jgi:hypothetical protein
MISSYALAFSASFCFIALRSWQQLNVVRRAYWWILPTSFCMAACEVFVIANVAQFGFGWLVLWVGLGGGLGSLSATFAHHRWVK